MRLSRLIEFLLKVERESPDDRIVVVAIERNMNLEEDQEPLYLTEIVKLVGIHEEKTRIVMKAREFNGND